MLPKGNMFGPNVISNRFWIRLLGNRGVPKGFFQPIRFELCSNGSIDGLSERIRSFDHLVYITVKPNVDFSETLVLELSRIRILQILDHLYHELSREELKSLMKIRTLTVLHAEMSKEIADHLQTKNRSLRVVHY